MIIRRVPLLPDRPRPLCFAHRGCSSLAPENTFASFNKARECGAPGLELDIHATLDGKLVVVHDDTFIRTAPADNNGNGKKPEELRFDEIRNIDVGSFFDPQYSAERPPLLENVLEEFCPAMYVDIELKSRRTKGDPRPVLLEKKIKSMGTKINSAVTVSSFNPFCLKTFKKELNSISTAIIWCSDPEVPLILRRGFGRMLSSCDYLKPIHKQVNAFSMFRFSFLEKRPVVPWTIDDPELARKLIDGGSEGIITNCPQKMTWLCY
jgi:glycerophosphoryl diester phosphodiesterase